MNQTITIPEGYELKKVSASEYKIVKKELALPDSWEEFCKNHLVQPNESCVSRTSEIVVIHKNFERDRNKDTDKNLLPHSEYAEAILALCQLIQLRDCYRQGWKPDWQQSSIFHNSIIFRRGNLEQDSFNVTHQIFAFQSPEIRDKFLKNFGYLIERVKPLFQ